MDSCEKKRNQDALIDRSGDSGVKRNISKGAVVQFGLRRLFFAFPAEGFLSDWIDE